MAKEMAETLGLKEGEEFLIHFETRGRGPKKDA
jgi:hypothetical protein